MKKRLKNCVIVIPLHLPLGYPCDYIDQTAHILSKKNLVIFFDFQDPTLWHESVKLLGEIKDYFIRVAKGNVGEEIYFRPFSVFPTRNISFIYKMNLYLGIIQLKLLLMFKRKKIILWGFDPVMEKVIQKIGENISLYDCIDYLGEDEITKSLKESEKKLFKR